VHWLDLQTDFFKPLWIRVAVVVVCLGWAVFEFTTGAVFWGMLFGGMGVYALWQFFLDNWPASEDANSGD